MQLVKKLDYWGHFSYILLRDCSDSLPELCSQERRNEFVGILKEMYEILEADLTPALNCDSITVQSKTLAACDYSLLQEASRTLSDTLFALGYVDTRVRVYASRNKLYTTMEFVER